MALILVALSPAYGIPILLVALGHARIRQKVVSGTPPELTVLVAARNESEHIEACLRAVPSDIWSAPGRSIRALLSR